MAETANQFLTSWINDYILAESVTLDEIDSVMEDILKDAEEGKIDIADLNQEAGGNLRAHIEKILRDLDRDART